MVDRSEFFQSARVGPVFERALLGNADDLERIVGNVGGAVHHERPMPEVCDLPEIMDFWTVREYVYLAQLMLASRDSSAAQTQELEDVLAKLDELEKTEASSLAQEWSNLRMSDQDSRRFEASLYGRAFTVFDREQNRMQQKLLEHACLRPDAAKLDDLLTGDTSCSCSLMTRRDGGFPSHPKSQCWPLRMYIYARQSVEEDDAMAERLEQTLEIIQKFGQEVVESVFDGMELFTAVQRANLCVLLGIPN